MNQLLNVEEAARLLGISTWTIRSYVRDRKLNPVRIGRRVLLEISEIENFVSKSKGESPDMASENV
jgi:excisionase family DNA binding protein